MYGLNPSDIEYLAHFRNTEITQICVGSSDIQFNFHPRGNISVQGRCELIDSNSAIIDFWEEKTRTGVFRFPEIIHTRVKDISIDTPKSLVLKFENKLSLRMVDNSDHYESFSVGNLFV